MAQSRIKAGRHSAYGLGAESGIAINSLAAQSGMFLKSLADGSDLFVAKAVAGDSIIGVSQSEITYASNNETVSQKQITYTPKTDNDTWIIQSTGQQILFSADLVTSNVINLNVNGAALSPAITFATSTAATCSAIAAGILSQFGSVLDACVGSGNRTILITPKAANSSVVVSNVVVTLGASQATATISEVLPTYGDFQKFYDITSGQYINSISESTTTGTFLCIDANAKEYKIVNA